MNAQQVWYCSKSVPAHGRKDAAVYLIAEAPGPCETESGIPLAGTQGGNLYRMLCDADIAWANEFEQSHRLRWPTKTRPRDYMDEQSAHAAFLLRDSFLELRKNWLKCSNSYDRWPQSREGKGDFRRPADIDLLSNQNQERIRKEVASACYLLVCGESAWKAVTGERLRNPSSREGCHLTWDELKAVNSRLQSGFQSGWYLGHPRRWSLHQSKIKKCMSEIALSAGWKFDHR